MNKIIYLMLLVSVLSACASLSKEECQVADWYKYGKDDGTNGLYNKTISHTKACKKYNITVNSDLYLKGYNSGLKLYCIFDKGFDTGKYGGKYNQVCRNSSIYTQGYNKGIKQYCTFEKGLKSGSLGKRYESVCLDIDVYTEGYQEGIEKYCPFDRGFISGSNGEDYLNVCMKSKSYVEGYNQGVDEYCTFDNGVLEGREGTTPYFKTCETANGGEFMLGYNPAYKIYSTEAFILDNESLIESQIKILISSEASKKDRGKARSKIKSYQYENKKAKRKLEQQERDLKLIELDYKIAKIAKEMNAKELTHFERRALKKEMLELQREGSVFKVKDKVDGVKSTVQSLKDLKNYIKGK